MDILNIKYRKRNYSERTIGIGFDYGDLLYIKAGYKGSGINDVVWLGKVVSGAAKLCSYGNRSFGDSEMMVSKDVYNNLNEHNQSLLSWNSSRECYHGCVINSEMKTWVDKNS
ncbi:MAG: hypothetical protein C0603_08600 [Denitrovibrio sp.]|nr:MAG: hypothetical protein C0603_08600 [Denitrovibrio sp.]